MLDVFGCLKDKLPASAGSNLQMFEIDAVRLERFGTVWSGSKQLSRGPTRSKRRAKQSRPSAPTPRSASRRR
jgi:hypothetical protein